MLNLAINYGNDFINIKDIAHKEKISVKFLENIVSIIKPSDLIIVKRGASGGYKLSKTPSEIKLYEIIELLEGEILPLDPVENKTEKLSDIHFVTIRTLIKLKTNVTSFLSSVSLADLVKEYQNHQGNFMFYI